MMSDSNTICNSINVNAIIKNSFISIDESEHDSILKTIHIRSFRCFDDLTLDLSGPRGSALGYAAVYGRNGSGKSTLVGAVEFLCRTMRSFPADGGAIASVESLTASVREEAMVGSGTGPSVGIGFVLDGDAGEYEVSFDDDGMLQSEILRFRVGTRKGTVFSISRKDMGYDVFVNRRSVTDRRLREELSSDAGRYLEAHTMLSIILYRHRTSNRGYMDTFSDPGIGRVLDFLSSINTGPGRDAMDWLYANPLSGNVRRRDLPVLETYGHALECFLRRIDPDTVSVRYVTGDWEDSVPYELRVVREISGSERGIPANIEPAGTLSLIHALPRLLSSVCGGISVVDGLGAEVHESLLSDILGEILPDLRGQLVFTTHSTALLNIIDPRHVSVLDVDLHDDRKAHRLRDVTVIRTERRGRPPKGEEPERRMEWRVSPTLTVDSAKLELMAEDGGMTVIVTNLPRAQADTNNLRQGITAESVLRLYLDQYKIEHTYRLMKSGFGVDRVFLHTPSRENAMMFVVGIATLICDIIDALGRRHNAYQRSATFKTVTEELYGTQIRYDRGTDSLHVEDPPERADQRRPSWS